MYYLHILYTEPTCFPELNHETYWESNNSNSYPNSTKAWARITRPAIVYLQLLVLIKTYVMMYAHQNKFQPRTYQFLIVNPTIPTHNPIAPACYCELNHDTYCESNNSLTYPNSTEAWAGIIRPAIVYLQLLVLIKTYVMMYVHQIKLRPRLYQLPIVNPTIPALIPIAPACFSELNHDTYCESNNSCPCHNSMSKN